MKADEGEFFDGINEINRIREGNSVRRAE